MKNVIKIFKASFIQRTSSHLFRSSDYWEGRYNRGGNSGDGSYGQLAKFKAATINKLVNELGISKIVEFGCGDGNNAGLYQIKDYVGLDISIQALSICRNRFANDKTKRFAHISEFNEKAEMSMSIDVIFHLVEDIVYEDYMARLFASASRYVLIYSSCVNFCPPATHVRHRNFLGWISRNCPEARIETIIANPYPVQDLLKDVPGSSFADFFLFRIS